ncbi:hypothetical protein [Spiroplasma endosymbiont of Sarcophaga variegata]|uniref:hypothetical protein n=1 Tax=Spiroplasma endosymbiont of Sarcophaga variegata TaxID=3066304 RepID=UPI003AF70C3D
MFFVGIGIGGWQLYLYLHQRTQPVIFNLNQITKINSPAMINTKNVYQVEESEIKDSLKYLILQEVISYSRGATFLDYDYHLFSDNKDAVFQPVNLATSTVKIWVMISATPNNKFLVNNTNYLAVTLPMLGEKKLSIAEIKTLDGPELLAVPKPSRVVESDIRNVYDSVIPQAVKRINDKVQLNVDYSYYIYRNENEERYQPVNLTSNRVDIWIVITAQSTSKLITGYSNLIQVTLQNHKQFISFDKGVYAFAFGPDGVVYVASGNTIYQEDMKGGGRTIFTYLSPSYTILAFVVDSYANVILVPSPPDTPQKVWIIGLDMKSKKTLFSRGLSNIALDHKVLATGLDGAIYVVSGNTVYKWFIHGGFGHAMLVSFPKKISALVVGPDGFLYALTNKTNIWKIAIYRVNNG